MALKTNKLSSIKHWSTDDRPREKLMKKGRKALSDAELLAILIGSGSQTESAVNLCQRILADSDFKLQTLDKLTVEELVQFKGIGQAKAISIIAALELGNRKRFEGANQVLKITSSASVFKIMQPVFFDLPYEAFWILHLNNSNVILKKQQLSQGGITATVVDVRLVLKMALKVGAVGLILTHNHPSGQLKPSQPDIAITQKIKIAAQSLDIKVLDHLIITQKDYFSFADQDLL